MWCTDYHLPTDFLYQLENRLVDQQSQLDLLLAERSVGSNTATLLPTASKITIIYLLNSGRKSSRLRNTSQA
jgi:hypothetical protein